MCYYMYVGSAVGWWWSAAAAVTKACVEVVASSAARCPHAATTSTLWVAHGAAAGRRAGAVDDSRGELTASLDVQQRVDWCRPCRVVYRVTRSVFAATAALHRGRTTVAAAATNCDSHQSGVLCLPCCAGTNYHTVVFPDCWLPWCRCCWHRSLGLEVPR